MTSACSMGRTSRGERYPADRERARAQTRGPPPRRSPTPRGSVGVEQEPAAAGGEGLVELAVLLMDDDVIAGDLAGGDRLQHAQKPRVEGPDPGGLPLDGALGEGAPLLVGPAQRRLAGAEPDHQVADAVAGVGTGL